MSGTRTYHNWLGEYLEDLAIREELGPDDSFLQGLRDFVREEERNEYEY